MSVYYLTARQDGTPDLGVWNAPGIVGYVVYRAQAISMKATAHHQSLTAARRGLWVEMKLRERL